MTPAAQHGRYLRGIGVGFGVSLAPVRQWDGALREPELLEWVEAAANSSSRDSEAEIAAFRSAAAATASNLREESERLGGAHADALIAASHMALDSTLAREVELDISQGAGAAAAVFRSVEKISEQFLTAGGALAERRADLYSVRNRILARLLGLPVPRAPRLDSPQILVARDLAPADTAALDMKYVAGIITEQGGPTSHISIIAKQMEIPTLVATSGALEIEDGVLVGLNAIAGTALIDPDPAAQQILKTHRDQLHRMRTDPKLREGQRAHEVELLANIGMRSEAEGAAAAGAEGIGLLRTEFLFLNRSSAPSRTEQFETYMKIFTHFSNKQVTVRTLDAGSDKPLQFLPQESEENPALGVRGWRLNEGHSEVFSTQLQALADAISSTDANVRVMAPMISTACEAREFAKKCREFQITTVGVMIETPAAALTAATIADHVDFLSLGTNDLAQYTMAADRHNSQLTEFLSPWQPALLQLVSMATKAALEKNVPIGVCGEAASDPLFALFAVGLGVTSLSMAPSALPVVNLALRSHTPMACADMTRAALGATDAREARDGVLNLLNRDFRSLLGL